MLAWNSWRGAHLLRARGADACAFHIVREPLAGNGRTRWGEHCYDALVEASVANREFRTGAVESSWTTATCPGREKDVARVCEADRAAEDLWAITARSDDDGGRSGADAAADAAGHHRAEQQAGPAGGRGRCCGGTATAGPDPERDGGRPISAIRTPSGRSAAGSHQPNGAGDPAPNLGLRVNDLIKGLNRVTVFSGDSKEFVEWEYAFTSYIRLYSEELYALMISNQGKITAVDEDIELVDEEKRMSAVLHHVLVMVLKKHPLQVVRAAGPGRGVEGRRSIRCHYRPRDALRHGDLGAAMVWRRGDLGEKILDWERAIAEYEGESGSCA